MAVATGNEAKVVRVSIDRRTDLGMYFSQAERGGTTVVKQSTRCTVGTDCGYAITVGQIASVWYFTQRHDNATTVALACSSCNAELVEVADDVEVR